MRHGENGKLLFKEKQALPNGLLYEGVIWKIPKSEKYPDGIRYRLALAHSETRKIIALFDNHFPKGHHQHFSNGTEKPYEYQSIDKLIDDFYQIIMEAK